jgi:hypothetical protein
MLFLFIYFFCNFFFFYLSLFFLQVFLFSLFLVFSKTKIGFLTLIILFVYVVCVCGQNPTHKGRGSPCPSHKRGVYLFVSTLVNHLDFSGFDFGALGCLPFAPYHNFDIGCLIDFFILI